MRLAGGAERVAAATARTCSLLLGAYLKYLAAALGLSPAEADRTPA
jgi:hypothetical protein